MLTSVATFAAEPPAKCLQKFYASKARYRLDLQRHRISIKQYQHAMKWQMKVIEAHKHLRRGSVCLPSQYDAVKLDFQKELDGLK